MLDEVVSRLGLDILGLGREDYREILKPVVEGIVSRYSSRPSKEAVTNRIMNIAQHVYALAAAYLLERDRELTEDQVEFVITNAPMIAARYVQRLYSVVKRLGRNDLIPLLRSAWERYGRPSPIACPYCGFRAVTPDLVCIVCGREIRERDVKQAIGFEERLRELVEFYGPMGAREVLEKGYVLLGDTLKPPSAGGEGGEIVLHLSRGEKELLRNLLLAVKRAG